MRRKDRQLPEAEAWEIVDTTPYGVLSLISPDGLPYGVPVTLWRQDNRVYFHCAQTGFKLDCLRSDPHVSICCVGGAEILVDAMSVRYSSAILTGTAREITGREEKKAAAYALCRHYKVPENHQDMMAGFASCLPAVAIWEITVTEITGKARK